MFEAVVAMQGDYSQVIFWGLTLTGGVLGAFLPALERLSRLPYLALIILLYLASFTVIYVLGGSANVPLLFWGYLIAGVLNGMLLAWIARARSADIKGDGRGAYIAFIPVVALYLIFARGQHEGPTTQHRTIGAKVGLLAVAIISVVGTYSVIDVAREGAPSEFAKQAALQTPVPQRLDRVTTLVQVKAVGNRVKSYHVIDGRTDAIPEDALQRISANICSDTEVSGLFKNAGVEREFIYLGEGEQRLGSFVVSC